MKSELEDFSGDTDEDLAVLVQEYRATISDLTDEIEDKERRPTDLDEVMRDAIDTLKWERDGELERLEQIEAEQKRRAATSKGVSLEC